MKIFDKKHPVLFKVEFHQNGKDRETLTLCESKFEDVVKFMTQQISRFGSSIKKGKSTQVRIRETIAGKTTTGKDRTISFYGLNPKEMFDVVVDVILTEIK